MNGNRRAYIRRIKSVWGHVELEIGLSRQPVGGLGHLTTAILLDQQVKEVLVEVQLPPPNVLRAAITDTEPLEEQIRKWGTQLTPNFRALPATTWYVGEEVYDVLEEVLGGNKCEGLEAHLRLLEHLLNNQDIRTSLAEVVDLPSLERSVRQALTDL